MFQQMPFGAQRPAEDISDESGPKKKKQKRSCANSAQQDEKSAVPSFDIDDPILIENDHELYYIYFGDSDEEDGDCDDSDDVDYEI